MKKIIVILLLTAFHGMAIAENEIKEVKGVVTDGHELLVGAKVSIEGTDISVYTDMDGKFTLHNVLPGEYNIVISYASFQDLEINEFSLDHQNSKSLTFRLKDR